MISAKTFELQYQYKGKIVTLQTEKNFNTMINRHANEEGVYEIECVLIENAAGEAVDQLEATTRPHIQGKKARKREARILKEFELQQEKIKQEEEAEKQEKIKQEEEAA